MHPGNSGISREETYPMTVSDRRRDQNGIRAVYTRHRTDTEAPTKSNAFLPASSPPRLSINQRRKTKARKRRERERERESERNR